MQIHHHSHPTVPKNRMKSYLGLIPIDFSRLSGQTILQTQPGCRSCWPRRIMRAKHRKRANGRKCFRVMNLMPIDKVINKMRPLW